MSPILVPNLSELQVELDRLNSLTQRLWAAYIALPEDDPGAAAAVATYEAAWREREAVYAAIAELPSYSLRDLRVKAYAVLLMDGLLDGEALENPAKAMPS